MSEIDLQVRGRTNGERYSHIQARAHYDEETRQIRIRCDDEHTPAFWLELSVPYPEMK